MHTIARIIVLCLLIAATGSAATITYDFGDVLVRTPTANQVTKLAAFLAHVNADRDAQGLPAITIEQYLDSVLVSAVTSYIKEAADRDKVAACESFNTQSAQDQNTAISTYFGGKDPCP